MFGFLVLGALIKNLISFVGLINVDLEELLCM